VRKILKTRDIRQLGSTDIFTPYLASLNIIVSF
jgi:hypothetical protein